MNGLGKIQSSSQVFSVNKLALKKTVADKRGGIRGIQLKNAPATSTSTEAVNISASLKKRLDREFKSADNPVGTLNTRLDALRESFPEWIREILAAIAEGEQEAALSKSDTQLANSRIDRTFGVEPLSYKNMWKLIASDPVTLLQAQANIVPEVALQLLTWAGWNML